MLAYNKEGRKVEWGWVDDIIKVKIFTKVFFVFKREGLIRESLKSHRHLLPLQGLEENHNI